MRGKEFTEGSLHFYCVCLYFTQCAERRVTRPGARVAMGVDNLSTRFQFVQSRISCQSQAASMYLMIHFPPMMTAGASVLPKDKRQWSKQRHHRCLCWCRTRPNMEGHGAWDLPIAWLWASQEMRPAWPRIESPKDL